MVSRRRQRGRRASALTAGMKWWGWGDPERRVELPATAVGAVREELGVGPGDISEPVSIDQVSLPGARPIPKAVQVAAGEVLEGPDDRIRHASGRSYPDLVRLRTGLLEHAPDAVLRPPDAAGVEAVLSACGAAGVAIVPFGGGTSVVGSLEALEDGHSAVVSLELSRPDGARGRGLARRPGRHPRPLPAVLRGGHHRGLRGHPLRRPGLERLWPLRRDRHGHRARCTGRPAANSRVPAHGGGAVAARVGIGVGGDSRRDHRGELPGAAGSAHPRLRGLDGRGLRGGT